VDPEIGFLYIYGMTEQSKTLPLTFHQLISNLGPLALLAGVWDGSKGHDIAPSDDRGSEENHYRERMTFKPFGPVNNHEQTLFGLRYSTTAWRLGEEDSFHEELGYWLWDPKEKQVMRCFMIPRGVTVLAGGKVEEGAKEFVLSAVAGSPIYGICSNPFLDREFKTVRYELRIGLEEKNVLVYDETSFLKIKGREDLFEHRDRNHLQRIASEV